mgnify:CR=1 FL=1
MALISRRGLLLGASGAGLIAGLPELAFAQGAPVRGGTIVASMDLQPKSLDPIMGDAPTSDRYALIQMFEGLLKFDVQGNLQPSLATSWQWSEDKKSVVFKLREGVVFHDGEPFDAEAAVFNIARVVAPNSTAPRSPDLADLAGLTAVHVNRVLQELREKKILELHSKWLRILDMQELRHMAGTPLPNPRPIRTEKPLIANLS